VLAPEVLKENHALSFVFCAVSAALCTRGTVRRLDRTASIEGTPARPDIDQFFFMNKAPRSALTWHSEVGLRATRRPITQLGVHAHHDRRFVLYAKQSAFFAGQVKMGQLAASRMGTFRAFYVDHTRLCVFRAKLTALFGRDIEAGADAFAAKELTSRVRHIFHAR
jgi:hypothetical protein